MPHTVMPQAGIYAITDDNLQSAGQLPTAVATVLRAGVSLLQYRSKTGSFQHRLKTATELQSLCSQHGVPLIINDDIELCLAAGAAGVHLGTDDSSIADARQRLGNAAIIGVTCHASIDRAEAAQHRGASYVAFGRCFPSRTKPHAPPADLSVLSLASTALSIPVVAIGGINAENGAAVRDAGADLLAIVHGIFGSEDIYASTSKLVRLYSSHG